MICYMIMYILKSSKKIFVYFYLNPAKIWQPEKNSFLLATTISELWSIWKQKYKMILKEYMNGYSW